MHIANLVIIFREVSFFMRRGGSEDFMGGHIFSKPKRGGGLVLFQSLILKFFFKRYAVSQV